MDQFMRIAQHLDTGWAEYLLSLPAVMLTAAAVAVALLTWLERRDRRERDKPPVRYRRISTKRFCSRHYAAQHPADVEEVPTCEH